MPGVGVGISTLEPGRRGGMHVPRLGNLAGKPAAPRYSIPPRTCNHAGPRLRVVQQSHVGRQLPCLHGCTGC